MTVRVGAALAALTLLLCPNASRAADVEPVEYGKVSITVAEPPARFAAGWPSSAAALTGWYEDADALPINHALDGLLAGDAGLFARLRAASLIVEERDRAGWVRQLHGLLEFKSIQPGFCANARPAMDGAPSALREALAPAFVQRCLRPGDRPLVLRADTPASAVLGYFVPRYTDDMPPWDDAFEAAVRAEYAAAGNAYARRQVASALTRHPDPRAETSLLALYRDTPEGDDKIGLGMLLRGGRTAAARAIGNAVCTEHPDSEPCRTERAMGRTTFLLPAPSFGVLSDTSPQAAEPGDPPEKVRAMTERMIAVGFDRLRDFDLTPVRWSDPLEILAAARYLHAFDVETGVFPNAHDSLMRELAALSGVDLTAALFDEIPPVLSEMRPVFDGDAVEETGPYRLSVYLGGKQYFIDARNLGDWYDLNAVLALMNAVLTDRQSTTRLFTLYTDGQTAIVIAATPDAFGKAVAAGLIEGGDPGAAEAGGKAYEDAVFGRAR
jgi:hypothetical protein